jgi:predicted protein tyrosine phosphatase
MPATLSQPSLKGFIGSVVQNVLRTGSKLHVLFVCTEGIRRSPTAVDLFRKSRLYDARFCGTNPLSPKPIDQAMIDWADIIFVMSENEDGHRTFVERHFNTYRKLIYDLDIPNVFSRGDSELITTIRQRVAQHIPVDV